MFGPEAPTSLSQDLIDVESQSTLLNMQLEVDKNESDLALSVLYRSRVDFRDKEEEFLSKIQNLKAEISSFTPKISELESGIITKSDEL